MQFYIYILLCADNSFYVGQTNDLVKRLFEHNSKKFSGYTSTKLPIVLLYSKAFATRSSALAMEKRIKKWSHNKKQALISGDIVLM